MDVKGSVQLGPLSRNAHDTASGISDIEFFPLMLVWNAGDLKWGTNFGIYAPTGGFITGKLANTGKDYWTFEPGLPGPSTGSAEPVRRRATVPLALILVFNNYSIEGQT